MILYSDGFNNTFAPLVEIQTLSPSSVKVQVEQVLNFKSFLRIPKVNSATIQTSMVRGILKHMLE